MFVSTASQCCAGTHIWFSEPVTADALKPCTCQDVLNTGGVPATSSRSILLGKHTSMDCSRCCWCASPVLPEAPYLSADSGLWTAAVRYDRAPDDGFNDEEVVTVQLLSERESQPPQPAAVPA